MVFETGKTANRYSNRHFIWTSLGISCKFRLIFIEISTNRENSEHIESLMEQTQNHTIIDHDNVNISRGKSYFSILIYNFKF